MKEKLITKDLFLTAALCPVRAWHQARQAAPEFLSVYDEFLMEEGLAIHKLAQQLFPKGILVLGDNISAAEKTAQLLKDPSVSVLFEATIIIKNGITRADILKKTPSGLHLYEIKSGFEPKDEYLDDLAYTSMICIKAGLPISACSLLLLNKEYRLGMPVKDLFQHEDCTEEILVRSGLFWNQYKEIVTSVFSEKKIASEFKFACKGCDHISSCFKKNPEYHIFDLPRLSPTKFCQLRDLNIRSIQHIPDDFELTPNQRKVRAAVQSGTPYLDKAGLKREIGKLVYPLYFLDFETVTTAIPLYEGIGPHTQIPTQYSLHVLTEKGKLSHFEYLSDPKKDGREELAKGLIKECGCEGSIFTYTTFEKNIINGLIDLFPGLRKPLEGIINRLVDLCDLLRKYYYHPDFHGSYSIKNVLPVMVPELSYEGMEIGNGGDAVTFFANMARGKYDSKEAKKVRQDLLNYCKLDTLAMVRVWEKLEESV